MTANWRWVGWVLVSVLIPFLGIGPAAGTDRRAGASRTAEARLTLEECWRTALERNRELQIERVNPVLARLTLDLAGGAYDPLLVVDNRWESLADSGGLDPADFSRDAIYEADSEVSRMGLTGLLPSGMTYTLAGDYAHSDGLRNFLDFDSYSLRMAATVRQPLLRNAWIDSARFNVRVSRLAVRSTEEALRFRVLEVMCRVAVAFHELGFAREQRRIQADLRDVRRALLQSVRQRIQGGTLTVLDESQAAAQLASAEAGLAAADQAVALAAHELRTLLGDDWSDPRKALTELDGALELRPFVLDLDDSWQRAIADRPDLAQLRLEMDRSDLDVRFWRNQLFPNLDVLAGYGRRGASTAQAIPPVEPSASLTEAWEQVLDGAAPSQSIGFIFSMPLTRRVERSRFRNARELRNQVELRVRQHEEWVRREVADAHSVATLARERVALTREARVLAEEALAAEERKLAAGGSALFFVLQLQGDRAGARLAEARAKVDYLQAAYRLQRADGSLPGANGFTFNEGNHPLP